jgi:hypothetical protein
MNLLTCLLGVFTELIRTIGVKGA